MSITITLPDDYIEAVPRDVKNKKDYDIPGVYVFYGVDDTPLYVGKTVSFKRRFSQHASRSDFYRRATKVRLYTLFDEYEKDIYETHFISELQPVHNKAKTFYRRVDHEDKLYEIEERISEIKDEITDIATPDDFEEYDEEIALGQVLHAQTRIKELEAQLTALYIRKGTIKSHLSG